MFPVDLCFNVVGQRLPTDHAYPLYSALCRLVPALHDGSLRFGLLPISGRYVGEGQIQLEPGRSRFRLRLASESIGAVLPLAGKSLDILGHRVQVGVPEIHVLRPAPALYAGLVTFKSLLDAEPFLEMVRQRLAATGIGGEAVLPPARPGAPHDEYRRGVVRIHQRRLAGYAVLVRGLGEEASLRLQVEGLGQRRHLGCGFFLPAGDEG
jgi:CRISPR-associated protein Cas6